MKTCAACSVQFNDGVQCASCKKHLDFNCANISESGWRKLGVERRSQWKCPTCRISSPSISVCEPAASLDTILCELRDMKRQLSSLPTLVEDMRSIKHELSDLRNTCEYSSAKLDEFGSRLINLERKAAEFEKIQGKVTTLQADLVDMKMQLSLNEQRSRLNNVEIKGVPLKKDENLFSILDAISRNINYNCPKSQINYLSRVPIYNSKEKLIIVSFLNRYIKEEFIAAARANKNLLASDLGFHDTDLRVYVNDHLSVESKKLLTSVKTAAKNKNYAYVWVKHGKIHIRKNIDCKTMIIRKESDLNKII